MCNFSSLEIIFENNLKRIVYWFALHGFVHKIVLFLNVNLIETSRCGSGWSTANVLDVLNSSSA
jgi:hypothetical protein